MRIYKKNTKEEIMPIYVGIVVSGDVALIALGAKEKHMLDSVSPWMEVRHYIADYAKVHRVKIVGAGLVGDVSLDILAEELWLQDDCVPFVFTSQNQSDPILLAKHVESYFHLNTSVRIQFGAFHEVTTQPLISLTAYERTSPKVWMDRLEAFAQRYQGKRIVFFSSTPQGGGVALMRHALIRLFLLLGVDAHWYTMEADAAIFRITKLLFHDTLQNVVGRRKELTAEDRTLFEEWSKKNAEVFSEVFSATDVLIIDDPQPSGMISSIKNIHPQIKIIYRSHIQIDAQEVNIPGTPQAVVWDYLWQNIRYVDCVVSHPVVSSIPAVIPKEKLIFMPATTDTFDGLNKELSFEQQHYYLSLFQKILKKTKQTPLDMTRPYLLQIARFDPSKGFPDVMAAFVKTCDRLRSERKVLPQLVLVGNTSVDDPEEESVYRHICVLRDRIDEYAADIKIAQLPPIDQLLNTLSRNATLAFQLSYHEGFEIKVTEHLIKGIPVIVYDTGGLSLQVVHGRTGFVVPTGDIAMVAEHMYHLLTKKKEYQQMHQHALTGFTHQLTTYANATRWLYLAITLLESTPFYGGGKMVDELFIKKEQ